MNTYRTEGYTDRSAFRRRVDTVDRLEHLRHREEYHNERSRLPRKAILINGLDLIDRDCNEETREEVRNKLRELFAGFDPKYNEQRA